MCDNNNISFELSYFESCSDKNRSLKIPVHCLAY